MTPESYIKAELARFAAAEGLRYGGTQTAVAIAWVIANRVRAGWEGGDWLRCLEQAPEFNGTFPPPQRFDVRDSNSRILLQKIEDVYHDLGDNPTNPDGEHAGGALFYADLSQIDRPWFTANILQQREAHPLLLSFGLVHFFL